MTAYASGTLNYKLYNSNVLIPLYTHLPPSTGISIPVKNADSSLARKAEALPTSSG